MNKVATFFNSLVSNKLFLATESPTIHVKVKKLKQGLQVFARWLLYQILHFLRSVWTWTKNSRFQVALIQGPSFCS